MEFSSDAAAITYSQKKSITSIGEGGQIFLDIVRALAAFWVLVAHSSHILLKSDRIGGGFGVVVFFLLSGFLITNSLFRGWASPIQFSKYMAARISRIFVPLIPVLAIVVLLNLSVVTGRWGNPYGISTGPLVAIGNLLLLNDYPLFQALSKFFDVSIIYIRPYNSAEPFWTVAIEFWIYIFVGFVTIVLVKGERPWMPVAVPLFLVSIPVMIWNSFAGGGENLTLTWVIGALASMLYLKLNGCDPRWKSRVGWSLMLYGLICLPPRLVEAHFASYDFQVELFLGMIIFGIFLLVENKRVPRSLGLVARMSSNYSYSLYLIHNTVVVLVALHSPFSPTQNFILAIVAANAAAFLTYLMFERHYPHVNRLIEPYVTRLFRQLSGSTSFGPHVLTRR